MKIFVAGSTMLEEMEEHIHEKIGLRLMSYHYIKHGGMDRRTWQKTKHFWENKNENKQKRTS